MPDAFQATPNAESYVLQADALRRRQLRAALLYGSSRYWRRRQRVWPAVIAGGILAAVLAGVIVVAGAFDAQQVINDERRQGLDEPATTGSPQPSPPVVGENASPASGVPAAQEPGRGTPGSDPAVR
ncbi:ABC transporter permease [Streptomonospora sp. DSM 45055]|uniref:ABC transporter permease n=1 Tax=Streptomonospora wellingtoniae TaxID=3075544 RepID=A0ABU2KTJ8_9ACTN|nr:ABC transporter permease [Streptomonospora sp. DSM 45055]MDT0302512.1 ABC transporter permease [Streptomonospora sp. DSM 45055]